MIFNLTEQNTFYIIFFVLALVIIWVCLDVFRLVRKGKKELFGGKTTDSLAELSSTNELFFKISQDFKDQLEILISEEVQKNTKDFKNELQKASEEIIKNYKSQFASSGQETQKIMAEFSQQASEETKKITKDLSGELTEKFAQVYQSANITLNKKIAETEKEIENYKKDKFKELDQKAYRAIGDIAKKTIGKTIDLSDHEELVMTALEKAKKEIF